MTWPALGPQWFAWHPDWTHLLGQPAAGRPVAAQGRQTFIWGGPSEPSPLPAPLPEGFRAAWVHRMLPGDLFDALENFLDPTHTPFVHAGLVRSEGPRTVHQVRIEPDDDGVRAIYTRSRPSGVLRRMLTLPGLSIDETQGRFRPPSTVWLDYRAQNVLKARILLSFTPLEPGRLGLVAGLAAPTSVLALLAGLPLTPLLDLALRQDLEVLTQKADNDRRFGLDPVTARRVHTPNDLLGPHILRWLNTGRLQVRPKVVQLEL